MAEFILRRRFKAQPQYAAPIDREGLGRGAQFLFNPAVGPVDLVTSRAWTPGGDASVVVSQHGKAFNFDGNGDYLEFTGYPEINSSAGTFAAWFPRVGIASGFGHIYFVESTGAVYHQVQPSGTIYFGGSPSSASIPGWFNTTNRSLVLTSDGTAAGTQCYIDGKDSGLTWASPPGAWPAGNKTLRIGNYGGGSAWDTDGSMLSVLQESRPWAAVEAKTFHESQGKALFKALQRRLWYPVASASGGSTIFRSTLSALGTRSGSRQVHR